jgi:hypothetical protein
MRTLPLTPLLLLAIVAPELAVAQAPAAAPQRAGSAQAELSQVPERPGPETPAPVLSGGAGDVPPSQEVDLTESRVHLDPARRTGFSAGMRVGVGLPIGKAGEDPAGTERDLSELTSWRAPLWVDLGYTLPGMTLLGAYIQVGTGGNGDACAGDCDWSDIRIGAQAQLQFAPGAPLNPWLGIGLGYEWLSYRQLVTADIDDGQGGTVSVRGRATERFGGPELLVQGGLDFQVEDSLRVGPFASASVGQYLTDSFNCTPSTPACPSDGSLDGGGFHSWIGVGLRGVYVP